MVLYIQRFYQCRGTVTCTWKENGVKSGITDIKHVLIGFSGLAFGLGGGTRASSKFCFSRIQNLLRFYQKLEILCGISH